jgi:hypothetical protein
VTGPAATVALSAGDVSVATGAVASALIAIMWALVRILSAGSAWIQLIRSASSSRLTE